VYCPRCGTPNEPGDRFCSSCGAGLRPVAEELPESRSPRQRLVGLLGTTRRARILTLATAAALLVAVAAFIALKPADDTIPRDRYTITADRICLNAKRQIVATERRSLRGPERGGPEAFSRDLVPVVSTWRSDFQALRVPSDRVNQAQALAIALQRVEIELAALSLVAEKGDRAATLEQAKQVDAATAGVEEAVASLNLEHCAGQTIGYSKPKS
jgi:hypothetical protein